MSVGESAGGGIDSAIASGAESVAGGIAAAAEQATLEDALKFFAWVTAGKGEVTPQWFVRSEDSPVEMPGYVDSPSDFLGRALDREPGLLAQFSSIVAMDSVLANLRAFQFDFHDGLSAFLDTGMLSALQSLKPPGLSPEAQAIKIPLTLDELLPPERLKEADPAMVQRAVVSVFEMFAGVKELVDATSDIRTNVLKNIRG